MKPLDKRWMVGRVGKEKAPSDFQDPSLVLMVLVEQAPHAPHSLVPPQEPPPAPQAPPSRPQRPLSHHHHGWRSPGMLLIHPNSSSCVPGGCTTVHRVVFRLFLTVWKRICSTEVRVGHDPWAAPSILGFSLEDFRVPNQP